MRLSAKDSASFLSESFVSFSATVIQLLYNYLGQDIPGAAI